MLTSREVAHFSFRQLAIEKPLFNSESYYCCNNLKYELIFLTVNRIHLDGMY